MTSTIETEDGTQADRPKKKSGAAGGKKKGGMTKRVAAHAFAECNEQSLRDFVKATTDLGVKGIMEEFLQLRAETQTCTKPKTAHEGHTDRNRYKDVYCIDETRLILKWPEGTEQDYIHANWVKIGEIPKYICTQGPTEKTVEDFWRLVWQEKAPSIVMLCNIMECGKKKCEQYWPQNSETPITCLDGKLTIKMVENSKEVEQNIILSKLVMTDDKGTTLNVEHWQWKAWPDRGVPEVPMATFRLLFRLKNACPVVVHCSAGIGRTGTIVGLDIAYAKLCAGEKISLNSIVRDIRNQRHGSVQTDAQYLFMHRVLLALAENKKISTPEMTAFCEEYHKVMATKAG
ncbi:unnamed protein product [Caenorhabditis angaria]|uniref:Protein-tyrosine phosphatase n=1 Tax=Caenorhabditis angaria TaxID=860376 RepID=A0A9P1IQY6_9PELO|nr:unnamed protein product [Caenorhabditis angaria]